MAIRVVSLLALAFALASGSALAQPAGAPMDENTWSVAASVFTYVVPDSEDYVQPTISADRGWLHLETRFNYEDLDTGSVWAGYNVSIGERVTLDIAPMFGVVFGSTTGVAPGYKGSLSWRRLELYSETEYVFDVDESDDSFLYTWSELAFAPADWWRLGLVVQRTKAYETEFDIQRGFFAGIAYRRAEITAYVFNPDASPPTFVLGVTIGF
jgi:hypothetical protein